MADEPLSMIQLCAENCDSVGEQRIGKKKVPRNLHRIQISSCIW